MPASQEPMIQLGDLLPICAHLPTMSVDQLIGAAIVIARAGGRMGRDELGEVLNFDDEHIVGVLDFLGNLGVIETIGNDAVLTEIGTSVANARLSARRGLVAGLIIQLPITRAVVNTVSRQPGRSIFRKQLLLALGAAPCPEEADRALDHAVSWARYAGLLSYDAQTGQISLA